MSSLRQHWTLAFPPAPSFATVVSMKRTFAMALIVLLLAGCNVVTSFDHEEQAVRACEERLKESLTSPSSYQRLWSSFTPAGPVTKEELIEIYETNRTQAIKRDSPADAMASAYQEMFDQSEAKELLGPEIRGHPSPANRPHPSRV